MIKNSKPFTVAALIFCGCLCLGFWEAQYKALWTDEFYSQVLSINNISYADQFLGHIPEGGNAPLFYASQKLFLQLIGFRTPQAWLQRDISSRILLRTTPVIFMSLSVALIFYYFVNTYSLGIAFLSFLLYLSSYMLWAYWAESRPYALLVFLTTVQSIILLKKAGQGGTMDSREGWVLLAGTNILLSLTSILSLGQIVAASVIWWVLKERDLKKYTVITLIPVVIGLFYYIHAPKYHFFFGLEAEQLIRDNISRERFDFIFIFLFCLMGYGVEQRFKQGKILIGQEILKPLPYFIYTAIVLASSAAVLYIFALQAKPNVGFPITSRYFIYLTPIGVIVSTLLIVHTVRALSKYRLMQWGFIGLAGLLLVQHFLKTVPKAIHFLYAQAH